MSTTETFKVTGCGFEFTNLTFEASGDNEDPNNVTYSGLQLSNQLTFDCVDSNGNPCANIDEYPIRGYVYEPDSDDNTVTLLNVRFSMLSPLNVGILRMKVWNAKASDDRGLILESTMVNIGTVEAANPIIRGSQDTILSSDSLKLTIYGAGFDARQNIIGNTVNYVSNSTENVTADISEWSLTHLVLAFTSLNQDTGTLNASLGVVCTDTNDVSSCAYSSGFTQVTKIVAANPVVTSSNETLMTNAMQITLSGRGFDANTFSNNNIEFEIKSSDASLILLENYVCDGVLMNSMVFEEPNGEVEAWSSCLTLCSSDDSCVQNVLNVVNDTFYECNLYSSSAQMLNTVPTVSEHSRCAYDAPAILGHVANSNLTSLVIMLDTLGPINARLSSGEANILRAKAKVRNYYEGEFADVRTLQVSPITIDGNDESVNVVNNHQLYFTIRGSGFDDTFPAYNDVAIYNEDDSSLSSILGDVVNSSRTHLVLNIHQVSSENEGALSCNVTHFLRETFSRLDEASLENINCFYLDVLVPTIESSEMILMSSTETLEIHGAGFIANDLSANIVTMFTSHGNSFEVDVLGSTRTSLTLDMTTLSSSEFGPLNCTVSIPRRNGNSTNLTSSSTQVANLKIDTPVVTSNLTSLDSDQIEYTLYGHNFDIKPSINKVSFEAHCIEGSTSQCPVGCDPTSSAYPEVILATVKNVNLGVGDAYDSMELNFDTLAPYFHECELRVIVEVGNVTANPTCTANSCDEACVATNSTCWVSSQVPVLEINGVNPTLNVSNHTITSTTNEITIRGKGFDSGRITNNHFIFTSNMTQELNMFQVKARVHEDLICTSTVIVLTFDRLSVYNFGELSAQVEVMADNSGTNNRYISTTTQVATIQSTNATIHERFDVVTTDASEMTVFGSGFAPDDNMRYVTPTVTYNDSSTNLLQVVGANLIQASRSSLVFTFTNLQPSFSTCSDADETCAYDYIGASLEHVIPSAFDSQRVQEIDSFLSSSETRVGKLVQVDPSIIENRYSLSADSETLTIRGTGWDINAENNNVAIWTDTSCSADSTCCLGMCVCVCVYFLITLFFFYIYIFSILIHTYPFLF